MDHRECVFCAIIEGELKTSLVCETCPDAVFDSGFASDRTSL